MRVAKSRISKNGTISISAKTRRQHELNPGDTLVEITMDNCIVLVPQKVAIEGVLNQVNAEVDKALTANNESSETES